MRAFALVAAAAAVAAGPADIPTVPICTTGANKGSCYNMPVVGQGSCCGAYNISSWLSAGGIHIDTSCDYGSQPTIASAIAASGVPREKLWITSKINVESCATNMTQALYDLVLNPLQATYVDLLLLHHAGRWETDNNVRLNARRDGAHSAVARRRGGAAARRRGGALTRRRGLWLRRPATTRAAAHAFAFASMSGGPHALREACASPCAQRSRFPRCSGARRAGCPPALPPPLTNPTRAELPFQTTPRSRTRRAST